MSGRYPDSTKVKSVAPATLLMVSLLPVGLSNFIVTFMTIEIDLHHSNEKRLVWQVDIFNIIF